MVLRKYGCIRHTGVDRLNRKYFFFFFFVVFFSCTKDDIEDEFHFVFICPLYQGLRLQYIPRHYYSHPSMLKRIQLLNLNGNTLKRLSTFITKAFEVRNSAINDIERH